nr:CYP307A1 protein [Diaphanosoma celebensis]
MIELLSGLAGVSVSATSILLGTLVVLTLLSAALGNSSSRRSKCGGSISSLNNIASKLDDAARSRNASLNNNDSNKNNNHGKASGTAQTDGTSSTSLSIPKGTPPGPVAWPVIGSLHLIAKYDVPFEAFTALSNIYGDIFSITLGTTPCVVVNSFPLIKEVLITKGPHFGGRPNFIRYDILFGGDRDNSLALCDWSDLQKARRSLARHYCHPRMSSMQFETLSNVLTLESSYMAQELSKISDPIHPKPVDLKPVLLSMCANVFTHYMCSSRFAYDHADFQNIVRLFDQIFWDINQGYAVDFLPWLLPAYKGHMQQLTKWGQDIRQFIMHYIIDEHRQTLDKNNQRDFTDALLAHLEHELDSGVSFLNWNHALYELEDFLGGHSAIGNLLMRAVGELCQNPAVMKNIQDEIQRTTGGERPVVLEDRPLMPYTEAAILETLRLSSSPIVPHVAMQDTCIAGYDIKEGTMVFLNNYELNVSSDYWEQPLVFDPSRFIKNGKIVKPEYFIPFSTGKRACMGYRLVQHVSFVALATLLQSFDVSVPNADKIQLPKACVAVHPDAFHVVLTPRSSHQ